MIPFRADLHTHTYFSDGMLSPEALLREAKKAQLKAVSITDHDTFAAYFEGRELAKAFDIILLPGIEFSASFEGRSIHILSYGLAFDNRVQAFCERHHALRLEKFRARLALFNTLGMPLDEKELLSSPTQSPSRMHIARGLVEKKYVPDYQTAIQKYLKEGAPCYIGHTSVSVEETIDLIHSAHGLAILAHPHRLPVGPYLKKLLEHDFDGIECFYGSLSRAQCAPFIDECKRRGWLLTGGSDFHGDIRPTIFLGSSWISEESFLVLLEAIAKR